MNRQDATFVLKKKELLACVVEGGVLSKSK
jgi:hypothetical protein